MNVSEPFMICENEIEIYLTISIFNILVPSITIYNSQRIFLRELSALFDLLTELQNNLNKISDSLVDGKTLKS